jgi:hypothetical protein
VIRPNVTVTAKRPGFATWDLVYLERLEQVHEQEVERGVPEACDSELGAEGKYVTVSRGRYPTG